MYEATTISLMKKRRRRPHPGLEGKAVKDNILAEGNKNAKA